MSSSAFPWKLLGLKILLAIGMIGREESLSWLFMGEGGLSFGKVMDFCQDE